MPHRLGAELDMSATAAAGLIAFALCLIITPLIRNVFSRAKLLDHPDKERKFHVIAMPRVGGISIALSYLGALGLTLIMWHRNGFSAQHSSLILSVLPAAGLIFVTGLVDDLMTLMPWQKLLGQSLAAALAVFSGMHLSMQHGPWWLAAGLSFIWLIACTNAFNLIDGADGLAAGVALFAAVAMLLSAIYEGNAALALATASLAGCLFAFLRYNFHPASIFLGDCGSLTIGFLLGCLCLNWSQHTKASLGMAAPLMALALPLVDVVLAVGRRFLRSIPLSQGDRHHIHHKLLARPMTTRSSVLLLYGICCVSSMLAFVLSICRPLYQAVVLSVFAALTVTGIRRLQYIEFSAARKSMSVRSMLLLVKELIYVAELRKALDAAENVEAVWRIACKLGEDLDFATLRMRLEERSFYIELDNGKVDSSWGITLPLGISGELSLTMVSRVGQSRLRVAALDCLQASIEQKDFAGQHNKAERSAFSYQGAA